MDVARAAGVLALLAGTLVAPSAATLDPLRVMPLGDSITDGLDVTGGYRTELHRRFTEAGQPVDFVGAVGSGALPDPDHEGHPGWLIEQIGQIVHRVAEHRPDVVLLHIGTNDLNAGDDLPGAPGRLAALIDRITAAAPTATVYVSNLIPGELPDFEARAKDYNAAVPDVVRSKVLQGKHVVFVDQHAAVTFADLADGVHPSATGYAKMAECWWAALRGGDGR